MTVRYPLRVTVWNEYRHERRIAECKRIYPDGIHGQIASGLEEQLGSEVVIRTATLDEPDHGLTGEVLAATDVMTWWGHSAHGEVRDEIAEKIQRRVLEGMGLLVLHSGHLSKPFTRLMGTSCMLRWREAAEREIVWCVNPGHPIADGLQDEYFELPQTEMYGELFDIPQPDELVFISWFAGGEVFRSGCCFTRGKGRIFYFRPGHETYPIYQDPNVKRVIGNAVKWLAPGSSAVYHHQARNVGEALAPIATREDERGS